MLDSFKYLFGVFFFQRNVSCLGKNIMKLVLEMLATYLFQHRRDLFKRMFSSV